MNIFFGKISQKVDVKQIEEGYYISPKGSSWFGEIEIGDYAYIIGGNKIQLWKAKEWGNKDGVECLWFEIINNNLELNTSKLTALSFLKLTPALIVLTSRSARRRAFFKLDTLKDISVEYISDPDTYRNDENYRKIVIHNSEASIDKSSKDVQLYFDEVRSLKLFESDFFDNNVIKNFRDNLYLAGKGSSRKDNVIKLLTSRELKPYASFTYDELSMRSLYDTLFCNYAEKEKYYVVGAYWDPYEPKDQTQRFLDECIWENGYEDKFLDEVKKVSVGSHIAIKSVFTKGKTKSIMAIKARGIVTSNHNDGRLLDVEWEDDFEPFNVDFTGGYWETIKEVKKAEHIDAIWNNDLEDLVTSHNGTEIKEEKMDLPLNLILYGPPGTGKTHTLIDKYFIRFSDNSNGKSKEIFTYELVAELKWWEVIVLSLYDIEKAKVNELASHPLMVEKIKQSENTKPRNTMWYWLQYYTKEDCKNVNVAKRSEIQIFWKNEYSTWSIDKTKTEEILPDLVEKYNSWKNYKSEHQQVKRYELVTFHQSYSYEEFVEGIRPNLEEEEELKYKLEKGIFLRMCEKASKDPGKPYALFIDEINRGNISKIFGELITLIEPDKRGLEVRLPYSKSVFSVPENLWIIGTMNTADRSIALMDTALRRRFSFEELMPDPSLLNKVIEDINLQHLLIRINERIEFLLDRDHTIGHSYFMKCESKSDICQVFRDKIIPLLQEYFYKDWSKIQLVLGDNSQWGKTDDQKLVRIKKKYTVSDEKHLFGLDLDDFEEETIYEINQHLTNGDYSQIPAESFIHIYQRPFSTN